MIKVGFICEGKTERKIVESEAFQLFLKSIDIDCIDEIIDAKGNGNLLPQYLGGFVDTLLDFGAQKICILTDLDNDACITLTKNRIDEKKEYLLIVAVKTSEAWFLSDSLCMAKVLKMDSFYFEHPEKVNALDKISELLFEKTGRGASDKKKLVAMMLNNGFNINAAAAHPNSNSAKYFVEKLKALA